MNYLWIHLKLIVITTLVSFVYSNSNRCSTNQDCSSGKICYYNSENKSRCIKTPSSLHAKIDSSKAFYRARNCSFKHCSRSLVQRLVKRNTNRDVVISKQQKTKHAEKLLKKGKKFKLKNSKIKNDKISFKQKKNKNKCMNNKKSIVKKHKVSVATKVKPASAALQSKIMKPTLSTFPPAVRFSNTNQPINNACVKTEEIQQPQPLAVEQPVTNITSIQEEAEMQTEVNTATFVTEQPVVNNEVNEVNSETNTNTVGQNNGLATSLTVNTSIVPANQAQTQSKTIIQPQQTPTIGQTVVQPTNLAATSNQQASLPSSTVQVTGQIPNQTVNTLQTNQSFVPQTIQQETKTSSNQMSETIAQVASVPDNSQVYVPIDDQIITNPADISQDYSDSIAKRYDVSDRDNDIKFDLFTRGKPEYRYSRTL